MDREISITQITHEPAPFKKKSELDGALTLFRAILSFFAVVGFWHGLWAMSFHIVISHTETSIEGRILGFTSYLFVGSLVMIGARTFFANAGVETVMDVNPGEQSLSNHLALVKSSVSLFFVVLVWVGWDSLLDIIISSPTGLIDCIMSVVGLIMITVAGSIGFASGVVTHTMQYDPQPRPALEIAQAYLQGFISLLGSISLWKGFSRILTDRIMPDEAWRDCIYFVVGIIALVATDAMESTTGLANDMILTPRPSESLMISPVDDEGSSMPTLVLSPDISAPLRAAESTNSSTSSASSATSPSSSTSSPSFYEQLVIGTRSVIALLASIIWWTALDTLLLRAGKSDWVKWIILMVVSYAILLLTGTLLGYAGVINPVWVGRRVVRRRFGLRIIHRDEDTEVIDASFRVDVFGQNSSTDSSTDSSSRLNKPGSTSNSLGGSEVREQHFGMRIVDMDTGRRREEGEDDVGSPGQAEPSPIAVIAPLMGGIQ